MFLQLLASELLKTPDRNNEVTDDEVRVYGVLKTFNKEGYNGDAAADLEVLSSVLLKSYRVEQAVTSLPLATVETHIIKAPHFQSVSTETEDDFI